MPGLEGPEVFWRMLFMVGAMAHTMSLSDKLPQLTGGRCDPLDTEGLIHRLVPFVVAGLRAPATIPQAEGSS